MTVNPDGFAFGCVQLRPGQRLQVKNNTNGYNQPGTTLTMTMRGLPPLRLARGATLGYPEPISSYLAAGQHYGSCTCAPGSHWDVWILS
jgi:hypothetical protein